MQKHFIRNIFIISFLLLLSISCDKKEITENIKPKLGEAVSDTLWEFHKYEKNNSCNFPQNSCNNSVVYNNQIFATTNVEVFAFPNKCWKTSIEVKHPILNIIDSSLYVVDERAESGNFLYVYKNDEWNPSEKYNKILIDLFKKQTLFHASDFIEFEGSFFFSFAGANGIVVQFKNNDFFVHRNINLTSGRFEIDRKSRLWILEWYGLLQYDESTPKYIYYIQNDKLDSLALPDNVNPDRVRAIEDIEGITIATYPTIYKLVNNKWIIVNNDFPSNQISDFVFDKNGNLWITTLNNGIAQLNNGTWKIFNSRSTLDENYIPSNSLHFDSQNNAWVSTRNNGLVKYKGEQIKE